MSRDNRKQHMVYYDGWHYAPDKRWRYIQRQRDILSNVRRRKRWSELDRRRAAQAKRREGGGR